MIARLIGVGLFVVAAIGLAIFLLNENSPRRKLERAREAVPTEIRATLEHDKHFFLLSLDPTEPKIQARRQLPNQESFYGYAVLAKRAIEEPNEKRQLLDALYKSVAESDGHSDLCFRPRHGLSVSFGAQKVDILICFECRSMRICSPELRQILITNSAQTEFDLALEKVGSSRKR